jgi:hypothetical protein
MMIGLCDYLMSNTASCIIPMFSSFCYSVLMRLHSAIHLWSCWLVVSRASFASLAMPMSVPWLIAWRMICLMSPMICHLGFGWYSKPNCD